MILCAIAFRLGLSVDVCAPLPLGGSLAYWVEECQRGIRAMQQISADGKLRTWYSCNMHTWWRADDGQTEPRKYKYDPADRQ